MRGEMVSTKWWKSARKKNGDLDIYNTSTTGKFPSADKVHVQWLKNCFGINLETSLNLPTAAYFLQKHWLFIGLLIQSRDRQYIDTPVVCSVALRATQINSARQKHSYSSVRPVGLHKWVCVCVCVCEGERDRVCVCVCVCDWGDPVGFKV